jgi:hypothetical protein
MPVHAKKHLTPPDLFKKIQLDCINAGQTAVKLGGKAQQRKNL